MKSTIEKRFARTVLAASIAAMGATALPTAFADEVADLIRPDSQVEVGVGYVSEDSFKYGEYTGLHEKGAYLIGNIDLTRRNEANTHFFSLNGRNLGLSSRNLVIRGGEQGNFGLRLEYDEIPRYFSDTYQTPYLGAGTAVLTQPAGVTDRATGATLAQRLASGVAENMRPYDIKTKRQGLGLGFSKNIVRGWDVVMNYKREEKEGSKMTGAMMQAGSGGTRGVVIVPEPQDYTTDNYEALARYTGEQLQMQFGYSASLFKNANESLTWDSLFTGDANATGRFGLPPDNEFHQVNASGRYVFSRATTLSGSLSYGRMTQDEPFLPYSTGGVLPVRTSLDGKVYTTNASLRLNTRLMPKLGLTAGLRYDDRDNKTAISEFNYITGDRDAGGTGTATNALRRTNMPLDMTKQSVYADLDYHLTSATKLKVGYDFHQVKHNYEPTTGDKEHTVKAEVRHRFSDMVAAGASYAYSDRNASDYDGSAPLWGTYSAGYLAALATAGGRTYAWLEAPSLRKYHAADRKRDKLGGFANVAPTDRIDLQFGAHYMRDKYPDTDIGLTKASNWIASFDANLQASDVLSGNFFASLDQYKTDQTGAHLPANPNIVQAETGTIPASNYGVTTLADRTLTVGMGLRYKPLRKYEVGGNLMHSNSRGRTSFDLGSAITAVGDLPDLISRVNRLEVFGRYFLQKNMTVNLKYAYEQYRSADWAWDAPLSVYSVASVIGTNHVSPNYKVHAVGVSLAYKF
jgi:MtrB/PioB family decaheme-associated outer membrane protein